MDFSYIKEELTKQNKSISWLAKEANVTKGYISKLINNKISEPGISKINAINKVLNYSQQLEKPKTYLLDLDKISIEKYLYLIGSEENIELLLYCTDKKLHKKNWIAFSEFNYKIISNHELDKQIKDLNVFIFNNEFTSSNFNNIKLAEKKYLPIKSLYQQLTLLISDNPSKLSQLITLLKLDNNYFIEDLSSLNNDIDKLSVVEFSKENRINYIIGNGFAFDHFNSLINIETYFASFDTIIYCNFEKQSKEKLPRKTIVVNEENMQDFYYKLKELLTNLKE